MSRNGAQPGPDLPEQFDAIVVGSGIGGLTCGSLLAQLRGLRVLVLERHFRLGGLTHEFERPGGRQWAMGLHYVGQMGETDPVRAVMDLVTQGHVRWNPMPTPFERYHFPDLVVDQPAGRDAYLEMLIGRWPEERHAIEHYLLEVDAAYQWFTSRFASAGSQRSQDGAARRQPARTRALRTTREVLDACGLRSGALRAALTAQWGDYGVPPAASAFVAHATVVSHFLGGGWFPEGGGGGIADGARAAIDAAGGMCLVRHDVEQVIVEHGKAIGVRVLHGSGQRRETRELRAPLVISDAGAAITYERLLGENDSAAVSACREAIHALRIPASAVQIFLSLRERPCNLGMHGENHWMFAGYDHDESYARRNALVDGHVSTAFLSFPSLKDPRQEVATAEIIAPIDRVAFERWADLPWKRRGSDYERLKSTISTALLAFVEAHHPGFTALVDYAELATPLTVEHFTGNSDGSIYGLPAVPARYMTDALHVTTPVRGLLLTGSDVCGQGIVGAMLGGVMTVGHVLGAGGFERVMAFARTRAAVAAPA
jgi:phytoene dehydrogenase-like protein